MKQTARQSGDAEIFDKSVRPDNCDIELLVEESKIIAWKLAKFGRDIHSGGYKEFVEFVETFQDISINEKRRVLLQIDG